MTAEKLLTTTQAAEHLGLSPSTLAKARISGASPPFVKLGAAVRYRRTDLDEFVSSKVRRSTSESAAA